MKYDPDTIKAIAGYNDHQLANRADSYAGNDEASAFFYSIRDSVLERAEDIDAEDWDQQMVEDYSGQAHEIADGAPDVYTWTRWQEFAGTQAWQEDLSELGWEGGDLTEAAGIALYMIAQRLVAELAVEIQDSITDDDTEA